MASEGMKNMRTEDLKYAAEQMRNIPPEQIANISARVARSSPEELAALRTQAEAQQSYYMQGALSLKNQVFPFVEGNPQYKKFISKTPGLSAQLVFKTDSSYLQFSDWILRSGDNNHIWK